MGMTRDEILVQLQGTNGSRDLSGLDMAGADLSRLDLRGCNLSRADLSAADLRWAILEGADLSSTVLRRADARWSILRGANLRQADLGRANLGWSDISGADLTGADIDGTNFENVNLNDALVEKRSRSRDWVLGGGRSRPMPRTPAAPRPETDVRTGTLRDSLAAGLALPEVTPTTVAIAGVSTLVLIFLWGWLFRRSYFFDGFGLPPDSRVVELGQGDNFVRGLVDVLGLTLKTLIAAPLFIVALALVVAAVLALPAAFLFFGERILQDVVRPRVRPLVVGGLFVAYGVAFFLFLPFLRAGGTWVVHHAAPGDAGLAALFQLFQYGGLLVQLGIVLILAALTVPLWVAWRWFSHWFSTYDFPAAWRLRYPAFNSFLVTARESRLFARNEPLTPEERQKGILGLIGVVVALGTLLTNTGRVFAWADMCDGGGLPRVQLYTGRKPAQTLAPNLICERMLAQTADKYFVFFPSQTTEDTPGDLSTRHANLSLVDVKTVVFKDEAPSDVDANCATCQGGATGKERATIDPDHIEIAGVVKEHTANMVLLDVPPNEIGSLRVSEGTRITKNGRPALADDIVQGDSVVAVGPKPVDGIVLDASEVNVIPSAGPTPTPPVPVTLALDSSNPATLILSGTGWQPGAQVEVRLAQSGQAPDPNAAPITTVSVQPDGSFNSPIAFNPQMPTGPQYQLVASSPATHQTATSPWLLAPPATPIPTPTSPPPTLEGTPGAGTGTPLPGEATPEPIRPAPTETSPFVATNTPFPGSRPPGGGSAGSCTKDEFEYDSSRGFQKEIYPAFGADAVKQKHNFCPRGDLDLAFFRVKAGRWYKVATSNVAPGVDTVLAVGDLSPATVCQPAGCWSDDRAALTYESQVILQAVEDGTAIITVDNRGSRYGDEATYELSVSEIQPEPTATPTFGPTESPTPTATPTATRRPFIDWNETARGGTDNNFCRRATQYLELNKPRTGIIYPGTDQDWYETVVLNPGDYRITLKVPDGQDYALEIHQLLDPSRDICPRLFWEDDQGEGDKNDEVFDDLKVNAATNFAIVVLSAYPSSYGDQYNPYELKLEPLGTPVIPTATTPPTSTATLTPVPTPIPTASPTSVEILLPGTPTP